jgi:hypothetical protein
MTMHRRVPPPLFVVPPELTAHIPDRTDPPFSQTSSKPSRRCGRKKIRTDAEAHRLRLKGHERRRYGHRIDNRIAWLEFHLELAKEIRDELIKS